jgi:hypothetical protein
MEKLYEESNQGIEEKCLRKNTQTEERLIFCQNLLPWEKVVKLFLLFLEFSINPSKEDNRKMINLNM